MSGPNRIRLKRLIREAEGYLELGMARHALDVLSRVREPGTFKAQTLYLTGEALRTTGRFEEAIPLFLRAAELAPSHIPVRVALGWCLKRTGRLDLAIQALEQARDIDSGDSLVQYNLACYWSLAGNCRRSIDHLRRAIAINARFRDLVGKESDFDPIRDNPEFQALATVIV